MKHIAIILSLISIASACTNEEASDENKEESSLIVMSEQTMKEADIEIGGIQESVVYHEIECIGVVDVPPQNLASVHTKIDGFVKQVRFLPGDFVKKGELMLVLEHPSFVQKQQQMLEIKNKLTFLKAEFDRKKELYEQEASSLKLLQQSESEYLSLNSTYQGLRAELAMIGFNVDNIENRNQPQSTLELRSPINGYITRMNVNLGKLVMTNDLLYELVDRDHLHVELQVYAKDVPSIQVNDPVSIKFSGINKVYEAAVYLVGKQIDPISRTTSIHAHLINEDEEKELVLGSTFQAKVMSQKRNAYTLPLAAAVSEENKYYFFKRVTDGFEKVLLPTGTISNKQIEILLTDKKLLSEKFAVKGSYYLQGIAVQEEE
jgi:membrane fusion protein, heavy metal efflux system